MVSTRSGKRTRRSPASTGVSPVAPAPTASARGRRLKATSAASAATAAAAEVAATEAAAVEVAESVDGEPVLAADASACEDGSSGGLEVVAQEAGLAVQKTPRTPKGRRRPLQVEEEDDDDDEDVDDLVKASSTVKEAGRLLLPEEVAESIESSEGDEPSRKTLDLDEAAEDVDAIDSESDDEELSLVDAPDAADSAAKQSDSITPVVVSDAVECDSSNDEELVVVDDVEEAAVVKETASLPCGSAPEISTVGKEVGVVAVAMDGSPSSSSEVPEPTGGQGDGDGDQDPDDEKPDNSFDASLQTPEKFLIRSEVATKECRKLLAEMYDSQTGFEDERSAGSKARGSKRKKPLGPLRNIDVSPVFETEQVWEELALRNKRFIGFLERTVTKQEELEARKARAIQEKAEDPVSSAVDDEEADGPPIESVTDSDKPASDLGSPADSGAVEEGSDASDSPDDEPRKRVRFSIPASDVGSDDEDDPDDGDCGAKGGLEDGFFNIADMEAFANEAENLALDGRLMASDDEEGSDGGDEEDAEEESSDYIRDATRNGTRKQGEDRVRYEDFFDRPEGNASKSVLRTALDNDDMLDIGAEALASAEKTPLEKEREKLRSRIEAIEDSNVAKKPWQLQGEVQGHARPMNSLLESEFEHDVVARPKLVSTADKNASIEDIIKQRVFDGLFDDVVRKMPADYDEAKEEMKKKRREAPDISQNKPTEGLAEMYEREYAEEREKVSKAADAASCITQREEDPKETPEQAEVCRLFKRLSNKLDALSSLHFTPAEPKIPDEMEVKPNVAALHAEEAIPEAVSDAALLAPREVHSAKANKLQGDVEKNKEERRRARRTTKRHLSATNKRKESEIARADKGNPERAATRRAERTLQRPGKLLKPVANPNSKKQGKVAERFARAQAGGQGEPGNFTRSAQFFSKLQATVKDDIAKKASGGPTASTGGKSGASLKL